jgi:TPP-dependent pyruvate/acetoin dehydrogenase alpha subunit
MTSTVQAGKLTGHELQQQFLQMHRIRAFEETALQLFQEKKIRGSVHPYIGMEAIAVGVCSALRETDFITSTHRGHGHCIAKGLDLNLMMAEITGRETGYCRGKGGSMHITAMRHGMLGADAIVGGSLAIATGAAYALKLKKRDSVVVAFFGDGGSNQGLFHEAVNLASVLKAPVVFVCENNEWAISMPIARAVNIDDIAVRAASYGIPGHVVDGNDVMAVQEVAAQAAERAREGHGPTLIEAKSYRITPHSAATPTDSRPEEEREAWRKRDPIALLGTYLVERRLASAATLRELEEQAREDARKASEFAMASPVADPDVALEDVYAPSTWTTYGRLA